MVASGPTRSRSRELTPSDVRKTLAQRGVDLRQCQFTGASRVVMTFGCRPAPTEREPVLADRFAPLPGRTAPRPPSLRQAPCNGDSKTSWRSSCSSSPVTVVRGKQTSS